MEEVRKFYTGVLGYEEVFRHKRPTAGDADVVAFKVNDNQYIELAEILEREEDDKLIQIGFETKDARALRDYLDANGVAVPAISGKDSDGNYSFVVKDPEGHNVEFVEYVEGSLQAQHRGRALSERRISDHIMHVGVVVYEVAREDRFYKDLLGFRFLWAGGLRDDRFDWISLLTPDGDNWIEYMVAHDGPPSPQQLGVWHHACVGTLDIEKVHQTVLERGYTPPREPYVARDGRLLLHMFDKHNTRTEAMVRKPVQKPCCSENMDPYV